MGFEPMTLRLKGECSTPELRTHCNQPSDSLIGAMESVRNSVRKIHYIRLLWYNNSVLREFSAFFAPID